MVSKGRPRKHVFDDNEAIRLYDEWGSAYKVAKQLGTGVDVILRLVRKYGINVGAPYARKRFSEKEEKEMVSMYKCGRSQVEIAKEKGLSQQGVAKILKRRNVGVGDKGVLNKKDEMKKKDEIKKKDGLNDISNNVARYFLYKYHYLKSSPIASKAYGWFENGDLIGVAVVGSPSSIGTRNKYGKGVVELKRFALSVNRKNLASKFLSRVIRELKKIEKYTILVTYADGAQGHEGIIYKAVKMKCDNEVGRQIVGVVENRRLTGIHLQRYVEQNGISGLKFEESPGKKRYVLDLK